jgi:hypothetical protein
MPTKRTRDGRETQGDASSARREGTTAAVAGRDPTQLVVRRNRRGCTELGFSDRTQEGSAWLFPSLGEPRRPPCACPSCADRKDGPLRTTRVGWTVGRGTDHKSTRGQLFVPQRNTTQEDKSSLLPVRHAGARGRWTLQSVPHRRRCLRVRAGGRQLWQRADIGGLEPRGARRQHNRFTHATKEMPQ